ncbi:indolepyruvate ferredoxin oxidoreductase family protein [Roseiarcaceae bacterium H3SJ34-1]|uniref:indolepyruvate ferredoxin oxidoreductase family protein n=1 Tax=Terripilifer ovatus TaxID=3032367 RepID=UPI003AB9A218|nr:indolepyruvate ferredoxin oxidoreductase family protein [Roseiarcaceae bacterium H3SJ34-1]
MGSAVSLDDKYDLGKSRIFVSGTQAIVRLLLLQKKRDRDAGLNTAGYVTGYRGSPLGGIDQQMHRAGKLLKAENIIFQPGLNEDLAATAVWGSQQAEMRGEGKYDGVFALWYAKGPGVDRSGDVFRHANLAGTSKFGGVVALMGDDHTAESSTTAHQSEFHFLDVMMPVLNPAGVQEILDYGLYGWALSRYAGVWVGLKCVKDTIESTASIDVAADRVKPVTPTDYALPEGGLNIRARDPVLTQEARLQDHKREAIVAWLRANKLNKLITSGGPDAKIGVITTGKSYLDVRQAMDDLGIDEVRANALGLRVYKIACPWPIEPEGLRDFARGLDLIIVVEEKRSLLEVQVREELYGTANQPICIGKRDEKGDWLFPVKGALDPNDVAIAIGERLLNYRDDADLSQRVAGLKQSQKTLADTIEVAQRIPYFCSGCPHNSSTVVPEGMRAYAGIGCHYMVQWMDRGTEGFTQMGGEGANWIGEAPFSKRGHIFQNLGDGTYNHSGVMALRWAVDTGTNITYKILFNDAVAMTGGQAHEGNLSVPMIARQVAAENVKRIAIVTDEPDKYAPGETWPAGVTIHHRLDLDTVQRELAGIPGCTVLIFDQTCAAEKRRRRKRGTFPDPDKRVLINTLVCEGCGDCGVKSNCVSVQPLETEFGRKRTIDQSSCNKDFSCVNGFCPSFVTVHGARIRKLAQPAAGTPGPALDMPPEPVRPQLTHSPYGVLITGVGGTGVVTIGAILGMAAHIEGKGCGLIDMAGLAQKGGAVYSHVKLAASPDDIHAIRVAAGHADLVLGCDLVVSGTKKVLAAVKRDRTGVVVNTGEVYPGDFTHNADYSLPAERIKRSIRDHAGPNLSLIDASGIATALLGNSIAANMFMLGYAYQKGYVPLASGSIEQAIALNGEAVAMNLSAFAQGRRYAHAPAAVEALLPGRTGPKEEAPQTLDELVERRAAFLTAYQNGAYAQRYRDMVRRIETAEKALAAGKSGLAEAVARYLFKLMAVKDEYEVARLYTDGSFARQLAATFEGDLRLEFHLAPPILGRRDPATGQARKSTFGPWMMHGFKLLAALKGLRGSMFDIFGYTAERRAEQKLIVDYVALLDEIAAKLTPANHASAVALASLPEKIRGYGHVKERHMKAARQEEIALLAQFRDGGAPVALAAE